MILRWVIRACGAIAAIIALYLLAAVLGGVIGGPMREVPIAARDHSIGLVIGTAHTDLLLPLCILTQRVRLLGTHRTEIGHRCSIVDAVL